MCAWMKLASPGIHLRGVCFGVCGNLDTIWEFLAGVYVNPDTNRKLLTEGLVRESGRDSTGQVTERGWEAETKLSIFYFFLTLFGWLFRAADRGE